MTQMVCIGAREDLEALQSSLAKKYRKQEVQLEILPSGDKQYPVLTCRLKRKNGEKKLKQNLAEVIASLVVEGWEDSLLGKIINGNYILDEGEGAIIQNRAQEILVTAAADRRAKIMSRVLTYLEENDYLNLEGFVNFRLTEYLDTLEGAVEKAIDEYLVDKEYKEFIGLLRYFVETQEPRVEQVHVFLKSAGVFQLYDSQDRVIKSDSLHGFTVEISQNDVNYEDILISALITVAPRRIILHLLDLEGLRSTVGTLQSVFGERLEICPGCSKCRRQRRRS